MVFYTSLTSCFIPKARVLGKTLKKYNPTAKFYLLLSDKLPADFDLEKEPFDGILQSDEIVLKNDMSVPFWFYLHDVTELCTAVKGWAALELLERTGEDKIAYLDPDIAVFHSLQPLEEMLDEHDIIITPHRLAPEPRYDSCFYGDHQLYTRGVFNLGFVAVKKTEQGIAFLEWWRKMLESYCFVDDPAGLFTDQKLIDLAPAFFDKLHICRDVGYNISWWNITQRKISGSVDDLRANGDPVYFYHFSNYDSGLHKQVIKDHCNDNKDLWALFDWYTKEQNACGYEELRKHPCIYNSYDNGEKITSTARIMSRKRSDIMNDYRHSNPYVTEGTGTLYGYYKMYFPEYMEGWKPAEAETSLIENTYKEEYQKILASRSYRLSRKILSVARKVAPHGSKRRVYLGKVWRWSKRFVLSIKKCFAQKEVPVFRKYEISHLEKPHFTVVILEPSNFNKVYRTVESICVAARPTQGVQVLVAGEMEQAAVKKLRRYISGIRFVKEKKVSTIMHSAMGDYVLLLNDNMAVTKDFFTIAEQTIQSQNAAMIQCKVCGTDDSIYEAGGILTQSGQRLVYGFGFNKNWGSVRYNKKIDCCNVYGTLIEKNAYDQVGGLDDQFNVLYQLADLSFKLREIQRETMYIPRLEICDVRVIGEMPWPSGTEEDAHHFEKKWKDTLVRENIKTAEDEFLGRDRSQNRRTIFAVDDRIPCYDWSAGDRTTYHYYVLLAEMGYNLKIVGDEMIRREPYATQLEDLGVEMVSADGSGDGEWRSFLQRFGKYIDVAYLNRPHILDKYQEWIRTYTNAKIVYYCMDLHFLRERRELMLRKDLDETQLAEALTWMEERERQEIEKTDLADVVFTLSTYEKEILEVKLKHALVMLNPVFIYRDFPEVERDFSKRKDLIFVGGFGHTPNVDAAKWICKEIMPQINKVLPNVKLHLVGSNPPHDVKSLASKNVVCHGFLSDEDLIALYNKCRLSVVPLRYGAGIKGKVLEAMYHGLPIVSTSVGTEGVADIEGYIKNTDSAEEFANRIIEIYDNVDLLHEMGNNNQKYIMDHLGVESARQFFASVF